MSDGGAAVATLIHIVVYTGHRHRLHPVPVGGGEGEGCRAHRGCCCAGGNCDAHQGRRLAVQHHRVGVHAVVLCHRQHGFGHHDPVSCVDHRHHDRVDFDAPVGAACGAGTVGKAEGLVGGVAVVQRLNRHRLRHAPVPMTWATSCSVTACSEDEGVLVAVRAGVGIHIHSAGVPIVHGDCHVCARIGVQHHRIALLAAVRVQFRQGKCRRTDRHPGLGIGGTLLPCGAVAVAGGILRHTCRHIHCDRPARRCDPCCPDRIVGDPTACALGELGGHPIGNGDILHRKAGHRLREGEGGGEGPCAGGGHPTDGHRRCSVVHGVAITVGSRRRGVGQPIARRVLDVLGAGKAQCHIAVQTGQISARGFDVIGCPSRIRNRRHGQDGRCTGEAEICSAHLGHRLVERHPPGELIGIGDWARRQMPRNGGYPGCCGVHNRAVQLQFQAGRTEITLPSPVSCLETVLVSNAPVGEATGILVIGRRNAPAGVRV